MQKLTVYISSTFKDLHQYRSVLIHEFEGSYSAVFRLSRIMEYMYDTGKSVPLLQDCLKEVDKSDIYFLILGDKMGSCPPGSDKTYTEYEYEEAMEKKGEKFIYRLVSKDAAASDEPKFRQFRQQLGALPVHEFSGADSFWATFQERMNSFLMEHFKEVETVQDTGPLIGDQRFYKLMAGIVSLLGLITMAIAVYFLSQLSLPVWILLSFALLILLLFSCIVLNILKNVRVPRSSSLK